MKKLIGAGIFLLSLATAALADDYSQWASHKNITINTTASGANITGNVAQYPLLVRLNSGNFTDFATAGTKPSLRFGRGTTHLPYQVERWDSAGGNVAEIWVLVDTVFGNDTAASHGIQMYWGKSGSVDSSNGGAVFASSNGFMGVWHMGDSSGAANRANSVAGGNPAVPAGTSTTTMVPISGMIGMADTLRSSTATVANADHFNLGTGYNFGATGTMSLWIKYDSVNTSYTHFMTFGNGTLSDNMWMGRIGSSYSFSNRSSNLTTNSEGTSHVVTNQLPNNHTWAEFTVTWQGTNGRDRTLYKNGAVIGDYAGVTTANDDINAVTRTLCYIGRSLWGDRNTKGSFDEVRIANASRSADWVKLDFQTQQSGSTVLTLGPTLGGATVPGAPTAVTGTPGNGQVAVSWTAPSSNGGAVITSYTVTASDTSKHCTTTGGTSCTVTGLTNNTGYTFTVKATNSVGTGPASSPSASVTPIAPVGVPGQPTGVTGTPGNAQVSVSWTAPSSDGGSAITGYTVTSNPDGKTCTTTGALTCTVTTLTNGAAYTFTVTATNSAGIGAASLPSAAVTPVGAPGAPTAVSGTSGNGQVVVSWTAPTSNGGSAIILYTATASPGGATCTSTGAVTCTVTGLTNGTAYTFTVTATNTNGTSAASAPSSSVTPIGPPGVPTGVTATPGDGQAVVSWTAPSSNGGSAIILYTVTASPGGATCTSTGAVTCTVTSLAAGAYTFTVTATNAVAGTGSASAASASVTSIQGFTARNGFGIHRTGSSVVFRLPSTTSGAEVSVMDLWGRTVWSQRVGSGISELVWNGTTSSGRSAHAGLYMVRMKLHEAAHASVVETKIIYTP